MHWMHFERFLKLNYFDSFGQIDFTYEALEPVIDSSDMNPKSWNKIARTNG